MATEGDLGTNVVRALLKGLDNFQEALKLAEKEPQIGVDDKQAIEHIIDKAEEVSHALADQFAVALKDIAIYRPLKLRNSAVR